MTPLNLNKATQTAQSSLLMAGKIIRDGYSKMKRVSYKSKVNPVTHIDLLAEKTIIRHIRRRFPDHGFLAEESSFLNNSKKNHETLHEYRWVIDPLDGTANFVHGIPQSCVSIALEKNGRVLTGGVYDPYRNELFMATRGRGATLNGRRIQVSKEKNMYHAMLITGFPYDKPKHAKDYLKSFEKLMSQTMGIRRFGAAALDLAWIACGRAEGFWEYKLSPWDVAAGLLLVEEAGGKVTDFQGQPLDLNNPYKTLATNGRIHRKMTRLLA